MKNLSIGVRLAIAFAMMVAITLAVAGSAAAYGMLVAGAAALPERREPEVLERVLGEA